MPPRDDKKRLRREMGARRDALAAGHRAAAVRQVLARGFSFLGLSGGETVSGYHTTGAEMDCVALLSHFSNEGHATALPVVQGRGRPLLFRRWAPGDHLERGVLNIPVPSPGAEPVAPDILFVPLLAFDRSGYRLGYGAGYYDMTIAGLRAKKRTVTVGLAYAGQEVDAVPHEAHDERLDWIVTETGPIETRGD